MYAGGGPRDQLQVMSLAIFSTFLQNPSNLFNFHLPKMHWHVIIHDSNHD